MTLESWIAWAFRPWPKGQHPFHSFALARQAERDIGVPIDHDTFVAAMKAAGYAQCKVKGRTVLMHRAVWILAGRRLPRRPRLLDHRDTDGLNNQLENLRPATRSQNMHHSGPSRRNKSGFKGVSFIPRTKKWVARIRIRDVNRHLGTYKTPRRAALAYDEVALREVGEFAYLNFPTAAA